MNLVALMDIMMNPICNLFNSIKTNGVSWSEIADGLVYYHNSSSQPQDSILPNWSLLVGFSILLGLLFGAAAFLLMWLRWSGKTADRSSEGKRGGLLFNIQNFTGNFLSRNLVGVFFLTWLFGFIVYDIGMCTGSWWSLLFNVPLAALHSLEMFILNSDVSEVHDPFFYSAGYMLCFSLAHFFAAFVSMLFLVKLFGFNLISRLKFYFHSIKREDYDHTYVLWGVNDLSVRLAESIREHYEKNSGARYRIVIVRLNDDEDDPQSGINRIFEFLSLNSHDMDLLADLGCLITDSSKEIGKINVNGRDGVEDVLGSDLKLKTLKRLILNQKSGEIHMFFMNGDEEENIHISRLLLADRTIREFAEKNLESPAGHTESVTFHCHARYNGVNRVIEDFNSPPGIKVKILDSSKLSVRLIKKRDELLPVEYVDVEKDATVSSEFRSIVIGFREVGRDIVRFLYEYGAFVKSGGDRSRVLRSDFHCLAIDREMEDIAGRFLINAPAAAVSMPFSGIKSPEHPLITLDQMDCRSVRFYEKIKSEISRLNYIVIATGDDELNLSTAIMVYRLAIKYRKSLEKLCILVRIHKDEDGFYRKTIDHYNRLWKAQEHATADQDRLQSIIGKREKLNDVPLHIFGLESEIYTFDNVISPEVENRAKEYKDVYELSISDSSDGPLLNLKDGLQYGWDRDVRKYMRRDLGDLFYPTYKALMFLRRDQGQNMENTLHASTKVKLWEKAFGKDLREFDFQLLRRKPKTIEYDFLTESMSEEEKLRIRQILDVLAQTEHLRWQSSHEMLGYEKGECSINEKDDLTQVHGCITPWECIDDVEKRSYDYNTVDLALGILDYNHLKNQI